MSDFVAAALQRIRALMDTVVLEAEGIDDEARSIESAQLLVALRRASCGVDVFTEWAKRDGHADRS